jgi:hypothetical protein
MSAARSCQAPHSSTISAAQVFDEVAINLGSDRSNRLVDKHFNVCVGGSGRARRQQRGAARQRATDKLASRYFPHHSLSWDSSWFWFQFV